MSGFGKRDLMAQNKRSLVFDVVENLCTVKPIKQKLRKRWIEIALLVQFKNSVYLTTYSEYAIKSSRFSRWTTSYVWSSFKDRCSSALTLLGFIVTFRAIA